MSRAVGVVVWSAIIAYSPRYPFSPYVEWKNVSKLCVSNDLAGREEELPSAVALLSIQPSESAEGVVARMVDGTKNEANGRIDSYIRLSVLGEFKN